MRRRASDRTRRDPGPVSSLPRVDVLMATFNGGPWISQQIDSILAQEDVDVRVVVSDDGSRDGTLEYLERRATEESRLVLLPRRSGLPGVTANFMHLLTSQPTSTDCLVALSDQDDIWFPNKLRSQLELMRSTGADAVSSDVISFDATGRRRLIVKSEPQRQWDYIFEAAGPGSTYVFSPEMHARLLRALASLDLEGVGVHDWFLYALVRAMGGRWTISGEPTVAYRQHGGNVQGEHHGLRAARSRLERLRSGFYRDQFILTARTSLEVGGPNRSPEWRGALTSLIDDLVREDTGARLRIARRHREIRRNRREGLELAWACLLHLW